MSFINNKRNNIISAKITEIGRKKIALGQLNYAKWAIGDSEINYWREMNSGIDIPPKILLPADDQPDLKYFISDDSEMINITKEIGLGDINLVKLTSNSRIPTRGFFNINSELNNTITINKKLVKSIEIIPVSAINGVSLTQNIKNIEVGDIMVLELLNASHNTANNSEETSIYPQAIFMVEGIKDNVLTFNRKLPKLTNVTNVKAVFINGNDVLSVPEWNVDEVLEWNDEVLSYDFNPDTLNNNTRPFSFNIVTLERLAGYLDSENSYGNRYMGIIENYLSYNDELNSETTSFVPSCSDSLVMGEEDKFQKIVGIIHFENGHHTTAYGESFYRKNEKSLEINLPLILYPGVNKTKLKLVNDPSNEVNKILDSDIEYTNLVIDGTEIIVGKIFHQFKMVVIDDQELLTAMSIGSGRNHTLPMINGKLITSENGILSNGKQIYVTYRLTDNPSTLNMSGESIHCNKYLLIKNDTVNAKDIELKFNSINDFVHMLNPNINDENGFTATKFEIIYQITNINERPIHDAWSSIDLTSGNTYLHTTSAKNVINPIALTNKNFVISRSSISTPYSLLNMSSEYGIIGDDKVLIGNVGVNVQSVTYKSLIQIRLNPNQFVYTSNPTRTNNTDPVIVSEIGIYDNDDDLVMIGKLSNPIELSTKSNILIELSMDF